MDQEVERKYKLLQNNLRKFGKVGVAFSGGADSTLLLKTASDLLGPDVVAFFANSQVQYPDEILHIKATAGKIGAQVKIFDFDLLGDETFCQNPGDRCYHCKKLVYSTFIKSLNELGFDKLLDGTNLDDTREHRPGALAIEQLQVVTPLKDARLTKKEVRLISKKLGLETWKKHSASCLATRIKTGEPITKDKLNTIYELESFLIGDGFYGCRVKISGEIAILELAQGDHERFIRKKTRYIMEKIIKTKGLRKVFLDLSDREGILT